MTDAGKRVHAPHGIACPFGWTLLAGCVVAVPSDDEICGGVAWVSVLSSDSALALRLRSEGKTRHSPRTA